MCLFFFFFCIFFNSFTWATKNIYGDIQIFCKNIFVTNLKSFFVEVFLNKFVPTLLGTSKLIKYTRRRECSKQTDYYLKFFFWYLLRGKLQTNETPSR